jgi:hypothetical protein
MSHFTISQCCCLYVYISSTVPLWLKWRNLKLSKEQLYECMLITPISDVAQPSSWVHKFYNGMRQSYVSDLQQAVIVNQIWQTTVNIFAYQRYCQVKIFHHRMCCIHFKQTVTGYLMKMWVTDILISSCAHWYGGHYYA